MTARNELIYNLRTDIDQLYMHEDDAMWIRDNLDKWEEQGYESEEDMENAAEQEDNAAHQIHHVIECDLINLSEIEGRKVTIEDFTDGEFKS